MTNQTGSIPSDTGSRAAQVFKYSGLAAAAVGGAACSRPAAARL